MTALDHFHANQVDTGLALIERDISKLFKGTHPGEELTLRLQDADGREVDVTWRGGRLAGIFYVRGNHYIPADCMGPSERERWASPPVQAAASARRAAA